MKTTVAFLALALAAPAAAQNATTSVAATPSGSQTVVSTGDPAAPTAVTTVTTTPKGTTVKTAAVDPKSKMICQTEDTLGTRLGGHKVCMTREQWREHVRDDRQALDRVQNQRGINSGF